MSLITTANGVQVEAHDLIMRKENAWDIINGKKYLEIRSLSPFYIKRFLVPKRTLDMTVSAFELKNVASVHFHDYGNTWYLDCHLLDICTFDTHPNSREILHALKCHDFDAEIDENERKGTKGDYTTFFFGLVIDGILGTNLCAPSEIKATGGKLGEIKAVRAALAKLQPKEE